MHRTTGCSAPAVVAAKGIALLVLAVAALVVGVTSSHSAPAGWSAPQAIGSPASAVALAADEQDSQGRVYAAWQRNSAIVLSTWQGGAWGTPLTVSPIDESASDPTVAVDGNGRVLVAWSANGDVFATVVGSSTVTNLSHSATVVSDLPRAGFVSGLGFAVLWREMLVPGSQGCNYEKGDDASTLTEAHLGGSGWSAPAVVYTPPPSERDSPTWICGAGQAAVHGARLYLPVVTFNTWQVRSGLAMIIWDGSAWSGSGGGGGSGVITGGVGFPGGTPVSVFRSCVVGGCGIDTSTGVILSEYTGFGSLATATAGDTMLAAWREDAEPVARLSNDGTVWTPPAAISPDLSEPLAATGAAGGSFFVAYLAGGELRSVHLGTPPPGTFALGVAPSSRTVASGASATYALSVESAGEFDDDVTLSVSGLPSDATGTFAPNPTRSASTLTVNVGSSTSAGSYSLTITGTSKGTSHTVAAALVVQPPDFGLAVSPSSRTVTAGGGTSYGVTVTGSGGFAGAVSLSVTGVPPAGSASFSANPATSSSTLAVMTTTSTPAGTYKLTITATSGVLTHTAQTTLVVLTPPPGPGFTLAASPASRTVAQGGSTDYAVTVVGTGGFADDVTLSVLGLPAGASGTFAPNPTAAGSTLTVAVSASTPVLSYALEIVGTSTSTTHTLLVTLVVQAAPPPPGGGGGGGGGAPPDLTVSVSAGPQPVQVGDAFTYTFTVSNLSSTGSVNSRLVVTLPAGVSLVSSKVNRGPGCLAAAQSVTCNLDFFPANYTDTVYLYVTVTTLADLTLSARIDSTPTDANPANDTTTLTIPLRQAESTTTPTQTTTTPAAKPKPSIQILSARATNTHKLLVRVRIANWPIYKTRRADTPARGGCWLLWIDGRANTYARSPNSTLTTRLPRGAHHVWAELLKDNRAPLSPRARSKTVTVRIL